jgi:hypothetical protein
VCEVGFFGKNELGDGAIPEGGSGALEEVPGGGLVVADASSGTAVLSTFGRGFVGSVGWPSVLLSISRESKHGLLTRSKSNVSRVNFICLATVVSS